MKQINRNAWFWWVSITSLAIGIAIFILLPDDYDDLGIQRYRSMALMISIAITGLCVIIATRGRWFGKGL